jgi:hypothetical protein
MVAAIAVRLTVAVTTAPLIAAITEAHPITVMQARVQIAVIHTALAATPAPITEEPDMLAMHAMAVTSTPNPIQAIAATAKQQIPKENMHSCLPCGTILWR